MHNLQKELDESGKIPIFEVEIFDKRTKNSDYLVCNIDVFENKLRALRESLTIEEEKSDLIASTEVDIDEDFSLDEHLQDLYDAIIEDILSSDFYELY